MKISVHINRLVSFLLFNSNICLAPLIYIMASAHGEAVDALMELTTIDPTKVDEIRKLQNKVEMYSSMAYWLSNAVAQGEQAAKALEGTDVMDDNRKLRRGGMDTCFFPPSRPDLALQLCNPPTGFLVAAHYSVACSTGR